MTGCNSVSNPLEVKRIVPTTPESDKGNQAEYQSILSSLMYLAISTRPDISYAVGVLSKFSINPSTLHLTAMKRLLHYIKGTMHLGLCYRFGSHRRIIDSVIQTFLETLRTQSQPLAMSLP